MTSGPISPIVLLIIPGILIIIGITIWLVRSYIKNKSDDTSENRKASISTVLFVIGGIPLLIYPGVLIADVMSIAGEPTGEPVSLLLKVAVWSFMVVSTSYPVTYIASLIIYKQRKKLLYAFAPLIHFVIAILVLLLWLIADIHH